MCKKKIFTHVKDIEGQLVSINKISSREEIFNVIYVKNELTHHCSVKFNFFYKDIWF